MDPDSAEIGKVVGKRKAPEEDQFGDPKRPFASLRGNVPSSLGTTTSGSGFSLYDDLDFSLTTLKGDSSTVTPRCPVLAGFGQSQDSGMSGVVSVSEGTETEHGDGDEIPSPVFMSEEGDCRNGVGEESSSFVASCGNCPSFVLENEATVTVEGIGMPAASVYHDTMYSSGEEISDDEDGDAKKTQKTSLQKTKKFFLQKTQKKTSSEGEEDSQQVDSDAGTGTGTGSDLDNDDIDALLESSDGYGQKTNQEKSEKIPAMFSVEKFLLVEKTNHLFEFLPNGWLKVFHQSGMPVYFQRETRICTLSRPYGLGKASLRGHKVPLSAIPCLEYRRAKEEEEKDAASTCPLNQEGGGEEGHTAKLHTADDHVQKSLLTAVGVREYCASLFQFKTKTVRRYSNWKVGRGQLRIAKKVKAGEKEEAELNSKNSNLNLNFNNFNNLNNLNLNLNSGNLMEGEFEEGECDTPITMVKSAKIFTITRPAPDGKSQITFNLNPKNKTPVSLLSEYIQHAKRLQPVYQFLELQDSNAPYEALILVGGKEEGRGMGASKKLAKAEAAKSAILKLAPELKVVLEEREESNKDDDIFHNILITDDRISEIAHKSSHPAPYQLLVNALQRQDGHSTVSRPLFTSKKKGHLKNVFTMKTEKYSVSFVHQLHNFAKQMCSQLILKEMHPELTFYGQLLKLYGRQVEREKVKKKENQRSITDLQTKGRWGEPNWELLEKLKQVMKTVTPVPLKPGETSRIRY